MQDHWETFWNQRYAEDGFAYGHLPNHFFAEAIKSLPLGKILLPAEGEGRNAIHAAKLGWEVNAFDISASGQQKALQWAKENEVTINYQVGELQNLSFEPQSFDAIGLIYAHFSGDQKAIIHQQLLSLVKPRGFVLLEAFSKNHLQYQAINERVGGPKDLNMLHSIEEMQTDFNACTFLQLSEEEVTLHEGKYHQGVGKVIRMVAQKNI